MAEQSLRRAEASALNPLLVEGHPADSLRNVSCTLKFLARVHEDLADRLHLVERDIIVSPAAMNSDEHVGFALMFRVVDAAVQYAANGCAMPPEAGAAPATPHR